MTFEWAYNLQDGCVRYQHDPRIGLFYGILSDEVGQFVLYTNFLSRQNSRKENDENRVANLVAKFCKV